MKWTISKERIGMLAGALLVFFGLAFASAQRAPEETPGQVWLAIFAAALGLGSLALLAFAVRIDPRQQPDSGAAGASRWSEAKPERLSAPERERRFEQDLLALAAALAQENGKQPDSAFIHARPRNQETERPRE